jgi:hypothetical protein
MFLALLRSLHRRRPAPPRRPALRVEALEDRSVPSVAAGPQLTQEVDASFAQAKTDWGQTQTVAQFDPSLGTLQSVEIINTAAMDSAIQVKSLNPMPSTVGGTVKGAVTLQVPGAGPLTVNLASSDQAPVAGSDGAMSFSGGGFHDFGDQASSDSATVTLSAGQADLSAFVGTGTVNLQESARAVWEGNGSGTLLTLVNTQASAGARVIYNYVQAPASLSGFVYSDPNDNGVKEPGEPGIAGVPVALAGTDAQGNAVTQVQVTAADGSYSFTGLRPGTYSLTKQAEPPGYLKGLDTIGTPGGVTGYNTFTQIQLAQGVNGANNNFAEVQAGNLGGFVYLDAHHAGVRTPDDAPIPGTTVTLTGTSLGGLTFNQAVQTNGAGGYGFNNLPPGDYVLTETQPAGYLQGSNQVGSLGGSVVGDQFFVHLTGGNGVNYNFGELLPLPPPPPPVQAPPDLPAPPPPPPPPPAPQQQQAPPAVVTDFAPPSKRDFLGNNWLLWM